VSYLLRVVLPDRPGMLGALATALGEVGGDILSLDVVERGPDGAVDDLVVALPPGGLADRLITSAQSVPGVVVEALRPYHGVTDLHRDLELVDELAAAPARARDSSSSSSRWVSRGPANGRSDSTVTPGTACAAVIRLSGSQPWGSSTTMSSTATPPERSRTSRDTMSIPAAPSAVATAPRMPGRSGSTSRRR